MPYTFEDFERDYVLEHIHKLPPDEVFKRFSTDERLKGLSADDFLKSLSVLTPEEKKSICGKTSETR